MVVNIKRLIRLPWSAGKKIASAIRGYLRRQWVLLSFRIESPGVKVFREPGNEECRKAYSQSNQDWIVYNAFFKNKTDGFFVDVGANAPRLLSNTLLFEECGWAGLAIDPLPHMRDKWRDSGRKAKFLAVAASEDRGTATMEVVENETGWEDMLSAIRSTSSEDLSLSGRKTTTIQVDTVPLREVFADAGIQQIDYMSIDVEGHELDVLAGIDFDAVCIHVLTIENNRGAHCELGDPRIRRFMKRKGYRLFGRIPGLDDIYVNRNQ